MSASSIYSVNCNGDWLEIRQCFAQFLTDQSSQRDVGRGKTLHDLDDVPHAIHGFAHADLAPAIELTVNVVSVRITARVD